MSSSEEEHHTLNVLEVLRQQAARREQERSKIQTAASKPIVEDDENENECNQKDNLETTKQQQQQQPLQNAEINTSNSVATEHQQQSPLISPARQITSNNARSPSPSSDHATNTNHNNNNVAHLQSRVTVLENETESLRAVVDLARKENAALRDLILKMAKKTMGDDWKMELGIDLNLGTSLAGMGQPAAELTFTQRQRLIELLDGKNPNLLP